MINIIIEVLFIIFLVIIIIAGLLLIVMIKYGPVIIQHAMKIIKVIMKISSEIIIRIIKRLFKMKDGAEERRKAYSSLKKRDVFEFGKYDGEKLKWRVLDIEIDSIYVLCETIICDKEFDNSGKNSNKWNQSTIRKWLNEEFYKSSFDNEEKKCIKEINSDKVTLLSKEKAEKLMTQQERSLGAYWWLRSADPHYSYSAWLVFRGGSLSCDGVSNSNGVRPALNLKL